MSFYKLNMFLQLIRKTFEISNNFPNLSEIQRRIFINIAFNNLSKKTKNS